MAQSWIIVEFWINEAYDMKFLTRIFNFKLLTASADSNNVYCDGMWNRAAMTYSLLDNFLKISRTVLPCPNT